MKRKICGACGYDDLELFLDLGYSPIADAYTTTADETSPTLPLQLAVCTGCRLVQLLEVVDQDILFGTGYSFYSSASPPLSAYHELYFKEVMGRHGELAKRSVVEIGCNDGDLLRHFALAKCPTVGVDPASGPASVARTRGLTVYEEPFGADTAEWVVGMHDRAGVVIANHVLAHVESVADVLEGIRILLADDGVAYVEVQYLPDLLVNNAFDLVYHEHRNFFSLSSLEAAAERWGLYVNHAELTDRQGGSLRVVLSRERGHNVNVERIRASEGWLHGLGAYRGFQGRADRIRDRLLNILMEINEPVVGYGAPAKATTLLNFCRIGRDTVSVVVDTTPAKRQRFIPGTGIPIVALDHVDLESYPAVLLLAWNYAAPIMRNHRGVNTRWLIPIPAPVLL